MAQSPPHASRLSSRNALRVGLLAVALVALAWLGREAGGYVPKVAQWVDGLGVLGPLAFVGIYAVGTVAFVPGSLLTLAAGAIFGLLEGTLYVFAAAVLGSTAAFLVARYVARDAIARRVAASPRFDAVDRAIGEQGRRIVFLLRLSPVFPYNLLNYALGLTRVGTLDYVIASVGMLPGTLLYVYYGKVIGDVAKLAAEDAAPDQGFAYYAVLVLGLAATIAVTAVVTRLARRALREATGGELQPEAPAEERSPA